MIVEPAQNEIELISEYMIIELHLKLRYRISLSSNVKRRVVKRLY